MRAKPAASFGWRAPAAASGSVTSARRRQPAQPLVGGVGDPHAGRPRPRPAPLPSQLPPASTNTMLAAPAIAG